MPTESSSFGTIPDPISKVYEGLELFEGYPPIDPLSPLQPFGIIGSDDRKQVRNTREYPYRCICFLKIKASDGTLWTGTGWLAGPRTIITAGHCVYIHENGGMVEQVEIIPGCDGNDPQTYPYGSYFSRHFASTEMWEKEKLHAHDYGAIFLPGDNPLGEKLGYFGYTDRTTEELEKMEVCLSGYPGDKDRGTQWFHSRKLTQVEELSLRYTIDTFEGHSGAPLWRVDEETNRYVVGIHNAGSSIINHATRINDAVFQQIKDWRAEGG
jgi:glutamyl endopeptidase